MSQRLTLNLQHAITIPLSIVGGLLLLAVTSLFTVECRMAEPGGINEGGRGFPIHYYSCGVWGESFSWTAVGIDFIVLTLVTYFVLSFVLKRRRVRPASE